jgi:hypothetical protein
MLIFCININALIHKELQAQNGKFMANVWQSYSKGMANIYIKY